MTNFLSLSLSLLFGNFLWSCIPALSQLFCCKPFLGILWNVVQLPDKSSWRIKFMNGRNSDLFIRLRLGTNVSSAHAIWRLARCLSWFIQQKQVDSRMPTRNFDSFLRTPDGLVALRKLPGCSRNFLILWNSHGAKSLLSV